MIQNEKDSKMGKTNIKALQPVNTGLQNKSETAFFNSIAELIQCAKQNLEKQVNSTMVVTYFEIGRRII